MKMRQIYLALAATSSLALAGCNGGASQASNPNTVSSTIKAIADSNNLSACEGIPAWDSKAAYPKSGTAVIYNNIEYTNNWYVNPGVTPDTNNGGQGSGQPWTIVTKCGSPTPTVEPTVTPTVTPTITPTIEPTVTPTVTPTTPPTPPDVLIYPANIGTYIGGTVVQASDGKLYQCISNAVAGWCNQNNWAYAPATGVHWTSAWKLVSGPTPTPSIEPTVAPTQEPTIEPTVEPLPTVAPTLPPAFKAQGATVAGWPNTIAMGAVGGPNTYPEAQITSGGDDSFGGKPVDVVFKYAGVNGNGDPGVIDPPTNALRMTQDLNAISKYNNHASRVAIVEYTGEMSGGENYADFSNTHIPNPSKQDATYIMARHFASLASDAIALVNSPVIYNNQSYYGSLIMNPDLIGFIQQNNYIDNVNNAIPKDAVNVAVDQTLCLLTNTREYTNTFNPNGVANAKYLNKKYTGTPVQILMEMLNDGYPVWSINGANDPYWNSSINNQNSKVSNWFNSCIANPSYDKTKYKHPDFKAGFEGWVQANNWLIRTFAPKGTVTFGWQENVWAIGSGFWLHKDLTDQQIDSTYSTPVANWIATNAPSVITGNNLGKGYEPDYFLFDRYEMDDSAAPGSATLYNARSWDNYLVSVEQVSKKFNNIPMMLWQIPGSHIPYIGEATPENYNNTAGSYIFSTAPVYFFGDSNLKSDLSNMIMGSASAGTNDAVGSYMVNCSSDAYNCNAGSNYRQYLLAYQGKANNYDWSKDNGKLQKAANGHVFSILWGGGNTTNVIKNFSNPDDHGYLASKIINYYQNPVKVK